mmetsp:Transcript_32146/g.95612  ORF Transcript_32146/g.95612 Transcript_32146/m.95612 type:complete len:403 (-) Transcript_32146:130-1338(-)
MGASCIACSRYGQRALLSRLCCSWPEPCNVLIIGSSVACGWSAGGRQGWAQMLDEALGPQTRVVNEAIPGSDTRIAATALAAALLRWKPKAVVIALSAGNEGLPVTTGEAAAEACADAFLGGLEALVAAAERAGAAVVLGSVYPHGAYKAVHYGAITRVAETMRGWGRPVFDFLTPLDDGAGRWPEALQADPAHPNSEGHRRMFEATRPHWEALRRAAAKGEPNSKRPSKEFIARRRAAPMEPQISAEERAQKEKEKAYRTAYVWSLPRTTTSEELVEFFKTFELNVVNTTLICDRNSGKFTGIGYAEFETQEMHDKAISVSGQLFRGRFPIRLKPSEAEKNFAADTKPAEVAAAAGVTRVYVSQMHEKMSEDDLKELFQSGTRSPHVSHPHQYAGLPPSEV